MNDPINATNPTCFISYSHDSEAHKNWVRQLAEALVKSGVDVKLDQWYLKPGMDLANFMEQAISQAQTVLLIGTPQFAQKANDSKGGVGYEKNIITALRYGSLAEHTRFIPVVREGDEKTALPLYLRGALWVDMRNDQQFDKGLEDILRHIYNVPRYSPPPLGAKPNFANASTTAKFTTPIAPVTALPNVASVNNNVVTSNAGGLPALVKLLRRRVSRSETGVLWFSLFGQLMTSDLPRSGNDECLQELCTRAHQRRQLAQLIEELQRERPDLQAELDAFRQANGDFFSRP
jgi:hypothetical protein